ncbi:MAG: hypothetical protein Q9161_005501 [Pseudevernia consocians]
MLSISVTLLTIIFTALSSAEHNEQLAVADLSFLSNTPPSVLVSDELTTLPSRGDEAMEQNPQALGERDINFGWYSHYYNQDHLRQWIFGNGTMSFNISMSTCINSSDVAGVYQFMNGSTSTNATIGDIYMDLGYGTALANQEKMMAQTLINAQAAYDEISTFLLDSILCSGSSLWRNELRRQLFARPDGFQSNGRVMTVALQATGAVVTFYAVNGIGLFFNDYPAIKYLFAGIAGLNSIILIGVLQILQEEGMIVPYETAFMGLSFVAKARSLVLRATQSGRAGQAAGPCLTGTQLTAAVAHAGSGSAPVQELGVVAAADVSEIQAACANPD